MAGNVRTRLDAVTAASVGSAIARAVSFLVAGRDSRGLWCDFETLAGRSVDWVSSYVMTALTGVPGAWRISEEAGETLLGRQRASGGWGYNERIPEDADSTAWAMRALLHVRCGPPHALRSAAEFITQHQSHAGGFATFRDLPRIGGVIGEPDPEALHGWGSDHSCVTANVVLALLEWGAGSRTPTLSAALDYLESLTERDGLLHSYWWHGPTFATYHGVLALLLAGRYGRLRLARTIRSLIEVRNPDGGWGDFPDGPARSHPFATANALLVLMLGTDLPELDAAVAAAADWLLASQQDDGSWATVPILRIPDAHVVDPRRPPVSAPRRGTGVTVSDDRGSFTTATAVHALHVYRLGMGAHLRAIS